MMKTLARLQKYQFLSVRITESTVRYESSAQIKIKPVLTSRARRKTLDQTPNAEVLRSFGDQAELIGRFPGQFVKKKSVCDNVYIANADTADKISDFVTKDERNCPIFEIDPGVGLLTQALLSKTKSPVFCFESTKDFKKEIEALFVENIERITYVDGDFLKLSLRDSMDNKQRIQKHLSEKHEWEQDPTVKIVGSIGKEDLLKHLINSIIYQNPLFSHGRFEFFLAVPPSVLLKHICSAEAGYFCYRPRSILFQIFFEYEILELLPRKHFLPWQTAFKKTSKFFKLDVVHTDFMYLTRIVPRADLFKLISRDNLLALSFFIKQFMSGKHRIIPQMEKWFPNSGIRLICNEGRQKRNTQPMKLKNSATIFPEFVKSCENVVLDRKLLPNMDIFTEFNSLSPSEVLILFNELASWPEYSQSMFITSLNEQLIKQQPPPDKILAE